MHESALCSNADGLSDLPNEILEVILACLPIKDAVRTSILSRKWRYIWTSVPQLVFDAKSFNVISNILLQHSGQINKFSIVVPKSDKSLYPNIHVWINTLAKRHCVQDFTIKFPHKVRTHTSINKYEVPSYLFSCVHLNRLMLDHCTFNLPPGFLGFKHLAFLHFYGVSVPSDRSLEKFISSCPRLRSLSLAEVNGPTHLDIHAPELRSLFVYNALATIKTISLKTCGYLRGLAFYLCDFDQHGLIKDLSMLPHLRRLMIRSNLASVICSRRNLLDKFSEALHRLTDLVVNPLIKTRATVADALLFARRCPNLRTLVLGFSSLVDEDYDSSLPLQQYLEAAIPSWAFLTSIEVRGYVTGSRVEMELMKLLLAHCPSLQLIVLKLDPVLSFYHEETEKMLEKLDGFPRASSLVKFKLCSS